MTDSAFPAPNLRFRVTIGAITGSFSRVAGLGRPTEVISYRSGDPSPYPALPMPPLGTVGNVTLQRGMFPNDPAFWSWSSQVAMNTAPRQTVVITLLDDSGAPQTTWTLTNAWATRITTAGPDAVAGEVVVDSVEMAYETMAVSTT
jgi:phage tail-like protein